MNIAEILYGPERLAAAQAHVDELRRRVGDASEKVHGLRRQLHDLADEVVRAEQLLADARAALAEERQLATAMHIELDFVGGLAPACESPPAPAGDRPDAGEAGTVRRAEAT